MRTINICLVLFSIAISGISQGISVKQEKIIEQLFKNKSELYFTFRIQDRSEINILTKIISIDNVKNGSVWAYANKKEFEKFIVLNYKYKILKSPSHIKKVTTKEIANVKQMNLITSYPSYTAYESLMSQYATNYPSICKLVNIGTLPSGRKLLILKITDNINNRENEPQFLYTATMHGDETAGYIGMLNLIDYLLTNYGLDSRVTNLVNNIEIWINPLANPDGTYAGGNNTVNGATRYNGNAVDLNRNYPDPQAGQHPDGNNWQPETQFFINFADSMSFVMAGNFHGGAEVVNYPWDTWPTAHADENWWIRESQKYADTVFTNSNSGYFTSITSNGITNGYDWYQITGGRQDYMNYYHHCREFTVETSNTKLLPTTDFINNWNYNFKSYLNYMEESTKGIRGIVTDACTNSAIKAKIYISGHDVDNSEVYSALPLGNYHRPIYQGTYNVTFSAPGYVTKTINGISVIDGVPSIVNVSLNPTNPIADFEVSSSNNCNGTVVFNDLSGSSNSWNWDFGDGTQSSLQNPTHTYVNSGTYSVSLSTANCAGADSIFKNNYVTVNVTTLPITQGDSAIICGPQSLTLHANGTGILKWYDQPIGGTLTNTGNTFNTPILSNTTTYYVENVISNGTQNVGALNSTIGTGGFFTGSTYHYLRFTASNPFKLISVWVNANTNGNRTIELRNASGLVLQSINVNILAGQNRIYLNFNVPAGVDLQLGIAGNNNLYRNQTGANYPYAISNTVSITGNSANNPSYYYYFYDWEIEQSCESNRVPATAFINPTTPVNVTITANNTEVCPNDTIHFYANSTNQGASPLYLWLINNVPSGTGSSFTTNSLSTGDEITCILSSSNSCATDNPDTSNAVNITVHPSPSTPNLTLVGASIYSDISLGNQWYNESGSIIGETGNSYTPEVSGNYFVIITDPFGCVSDTSNTISFISTEVETRNDEFELKIYPNPNQGFFTIELEGSSEFTIELINTIGQSIYSRSTNNKIEFMNCTDLPDGFYIIKVSHQTGIASRRIIIKKAE